jgi:hypothetical protein
MIELIEDYSEKKQETFEVKFAKEHGYVLLKSGNQTNCPFQQPIPTQNPYDGTIGFMRMPCSTHCPMAKIKKEGDENYYIVGCATNENFKYKLDKLID